MEQKDKEIMNSINEFVLYSKGFYKRSDNIFNDILSLLLPIYPCMTKRDILSIVMNKWNEWNEKLPNCAKLTVYNFWKNINQLKETDIMINSYHGISNESKDSDEFVLMAIMEHIRYMDPMFIQIAPPTFKKSKLRYSLVKEGMTYKEMEKITKEYFK